MFGRSKTVDVEQREALRSTALEELDDVFDVDSSTDSHKKVLKDTRRVLTAFAKKRITFRDWMDFESVLQMRAQELVNLKKQGRS